MRNIKLKIEYDGKDFNGWQKQPTKLNIQGEIERAIEEITGEKVDLIGSGRTDAGVHALGQVANFKTDSNIPIEKFPIALNTKLKRSIRIIEAKEVDERFHSRWCLRCFRHTFHTSPHRHRRTSPDRRRSRSVPLLDYESRRGRAPSRALFP